jgi:poly(3-hydroxybutyrate) depolymerase
MAERYRVVGGHPLRYLLSVPAGTSGGPLPILCFLHGYGEAAPRDIRRALTLHGPLRAGSSARAQREFIVVAPQLLIGGDLWQRYADVLRQIISEVRSEHGGDPRRLYLTGFSFGGNGVFDLGSAQPDLWAALWAVDPTRAPAAPAVRPIWLSFGEVSRFRKDAFIHNLNLAPAGAGGDRVWHDDGLDHIGTATRAYADDRIYDWLLSKTLPPAK